MRAILMLLLLTSVAAISKAEPAAAEGANSVKANDSAHANCSGCGFLRGKPLPDCQSFILFESSLKYRIGGKNKREGKKDNLITIECGVMKNVSPKWALGLLLYTGFDDDGHQIGLRPRLRRWMKKGWGLDLSPGIILKAEDNFREVQTPGFVGSISIEKSDWIALEFQYQRTSSQISPSSVPLDQRADLSDETVTDIYLGARFGSYLGLAAPVILALVIGSTWN